ncbi:MAG: DUF3352 domain-containing protein [Bacteroidota bacterium]
MKRLLLALPVLFLVAGCGSELDVAGSAELSVQARSALDVLPADAVVVASLDVENARTSGLIDRAFGNSTLPDAGVGNEYEEFVRVTGFDPEEDIENVYAAGQPNQVDLVVYAALERSRLVEFLNARVGSGDLTQDTYRSVPIYVSTEGSPDGAKRMHLALANDQMILASSSRQSIDAMIDRLNGAGAALSSNVELLDLIDQVAHPEGAWVVANNAFATLEGLPSDAPDFSRLIEDIVAATGFERNGVDVNTRLITAPDASADDVADLIKGALAGIKSQPDLDAEALALLDAVEVSAGNGRVDIDVFVSQSMLDTLNEAR